MSTIDIFSQNLRYYRLEYNNNGRITNIDDIGLSQEQLAELTDFTPHYISDLERGRYGATFETLDTLSQILQIPVYKFFIQNPNAVGLPERLDIYRKLKRNKSH